jgi:Flp pilus assembly protein TadG
VRSVAFRDGWANGTAEEATVSRNPRLTLVAARGTRSQAGQALTEFALVAPILLLLVLAIADFGRIYVSLVAVEAAAREAADYGAFQSSFWNASAGNPATTTAEMQRRSCVASAGSHLDDYQGASDGSSCTNPSFTCTLVPPVTSGEVSQPCGSYAGTYCSTSTSDPPCTVHVQLNYQFRAFLNVPPLPTTVIFTRDSQFRISDLPVPSP